MQRRRQHPPVYYSQIPLPGVARAHEHPRQQMVSTGPLRDPAFVACAGRSGSSPLAFAPCGDHVPGAAFSEPPSALIRSVAPRRATQAAPLAPDGSSGASRCWGGENRLAQAIAASARSKSTGPPCQGRPISAHLARFVAIATSFCDTRPAPRPCAGVGSLLRADVHLGLASWRRWAREWFAEGC